MRKTRKIIIVLIITVIFSSLTVFASEVTTPVSKLIDNGKEYNDKTVTVKGEAIGELLERGENSFLNINDGTAAIGIYLKTKDGEMIRCYGGYHNIGDIVNVEGVFNRACKEHGGDMDIHCDSIEVVSNGYEKTHDISRWKKNLIFILTPFVIYGSIKVYGIIRKK